jgi:hypothetical protein
MQEYVFEAGQQNSPIAGTKEAADFMTTFYHVQVGALETQEFRTSPATVLASSAFWTRSKGHCGKCFFVLLPDGMVVEPGW